MLQPFYRSTAARYAFEFSGSEQLSFHTAPILSWTGSEGGLVTGDVFVWTHLGRPEVLGCIGSLPGIRSRGVFHEFHTLSARQTLKPIKLLATGKRWSPGTGSEPKEIPGAPAPAGSHKLRLFQMKELAKNFSPRMKVQLQSLERLNRGTSEGGFDILRLLPQPLHRHDQEKIASHPDAIDGAIFCYVWTRGTDPELLLLIEARKTENGPKWFYSPVRFTFRELWLNYMDDEVWHHDGGNGRGTYREPYITEFEGQVAIAEVKRRSDAAITAAKASAE